jgi:transcriptional regulator with XRE-family HTH domain
VIEVELAPETLESHPVQTPGGVKLRELRRRIGMTQLQVELDSDLGTGYLQRLESGRVQQPVRVTLDRILDALGARFSERRDVLELFGYLVKVPLPDDEERAWAASVASPELDQFPFPAYLLDCGHRLVLWNRAFPRLFGENGEAIVEQQLTQGSFLAAWFSPASPMSQLIAEPERSLPALLRAFRHEMRQFEYAGWYAGLLEELRELELFRYYWNLADQQDAPAAPDRALVPIGLQVSGAGRLLFRLSAQQFTRDTRFRVIYYFPSDAATMAACEDWRPASPGDLHTSQAIGPT